MVVLQELFMLSVSQEIYSRKSGAFSTVESDSRFSIVV
ncbi:hypothetical protein SBA7_10026 [Candidatus Sulfotelmatobacter sp. SbA7]|nr:hypothetical protein SBA7_10026 [Candidatus Sulfotelmatobacter sp. SbA7]